MRCLPVVLLAGALVSGCGADPAVRARAIAPTPAASASATVAPAAPTVSPAAPTPAGTRPRPAAPAAWQVGASPLPLRPDGFGVVLPTPPELRDRRLTAPDVLPLPTTDRFQSTISPISPAVRARMGATWSPSCPVRLDQLRYLTVSFRGFDGRAHTGEIVVNARIATGVVEVFRELYGADFPLESMRLPTTADLEAEPTGDGNGTAGLVCRPARGQQTWSQHAYGLAVDINPFQNPMVKRDLVLPELASAYTDRSVRRPGMAVPESSVVQAFRRIGWGWGGAWRSSKDWMHFSANGR